MFITHSYVSIAILGPLVYLLSQDFSWVRMFQNERTTYCTSIVQWQFSNGLYAVMTCLDVTDALTQVKAHACQVLSIAIVLVLAFVCQSSIMLNTKLISVIELVRPNLRAYKRKC